MGTANPKTIIDTHTKKIKQPKQNNKDGHQTTREQKRKGRKKTYKNKPQTIKKMAIAIYISIIRTWVIPIPGGVDATYALKFH